MLSAYLIIDLIVVTALLGLGIAVFLQNSKSELNRYYAYFSILISIYLITNYISNDVKQTPEVATYANYFVFFSSFAASMYLLKFVVSLTEDVKTGRILHKLRIPMVIVAILSGTPLLVQGVELQGAIYAVKFGPLAPLYTIGVLAAIVMSFVISKKSIKKTTGLRQQRVRVLYKSLIWSMIPLIVMSLLLPTITGWFALTNIGVLSLLVLVFGLYYGVVKHRLFNLRLLIVRSLGYVLSLAVIAIVYGVVAHTLLNRAEDYFGNGLTVEVLNIAMIIIVALTYPVLKNWFDSITNTLFYRDSYDTQELFDSINKVLVSTLEIKKLLDQSSEIISHNLKSTICLIGLKSNDSSKFRMFGASNISPEPADIAILRKLTVKFHQSVIALDLLDDKHKELKDIMDKYNVSVLVRLSPHLKRNEEGLGYIILGPKRSGNPYTDQDYRVLDTISKELILAIDNAVRFEEIQNFNVTLQARVEEATHKLRRSNEKLKALDETKDDFISMASHQLRTPLTSVKGYISMVLEEDAGKITPMQREMLGQAFFSSQRMVYLIADLLNVSRLKTGKFIIERAPIHLDQIVQQELRQLQETAAARSLTLEYTQPTGFPTMMLDETKTRQIIMNFIDNAIYYTPAGGHIVVRLVNKDQTIELRVEDNGIGVPKAEQAHLFTKFYRAGNARQARPDGTGLGLFMAKKVIVAQGGSLLFESEEGKGSTFGFIFSKSWAAETPAPKDPAVRALPVKPEPAKKT